MDNDIGGIELALSEIAFGPVEYARAAVSPPQFDGVMRHLLLRKQRMGKAELDAGDCGHLAFALAFTPDVTVGTRLFCQRPELFPKDTTRPLYAKPQSEHSLTRDT